MRQTILWEEPNRAKTPPLHIASRGMRYSSLTGVWWLDDYRFVVNHRSGLRLALFDIRHGNNPVHKIAIPHLTDDVAAYQVSDERWEVIVSGCWACAYSKFSLDKDGFTLIETVAESRWPHALLSKLRRLTFCHGAAYSKNGQLIVTFHTGANPRIVDITHKKTWRLPKPWGARDACFDQESRLYAVAVTANPALSAYSDTTAGVWKLVNDQFVMLAECPGGHFDACDIFDGSLYTNNQYSDTVSVFDIHSGKESTPLQHNDYSFPHGIGVSPSGILAVTNYGNSTVVLTTL